MKSLLLTLITAAGVAACVGTDDTTVTDDTTDPARTTGTADLGTIAKPAPGTGVIDGVACGPAPGTDGPTVLCGKGEWCCNYHCAPEAELCGAIDPDPKPKPEPTGEACGPVPGTDGPTVLCGKHEQCCNYHCAPEAELCGALP